MRRCTTFSPVCRRSQQRENQEWWRRSWFRTCWMVSSRWRFPCAQSADLELYSVYLFVQPSTASVWIVGGTDLDVQGASRQAESCGAGASLVPSTLAYADVMFFAGCSRSPLHRRSSSEPLPRALLSAPSAHPLLISSL